jgi:hypothetical protein
MKTIGHMRVAWGLLGAAGLLAVFGCSPAWRPPAGELFVVTHAPATAGTFEIARWEWDVRGERALPRRPLLRATPPRPWSGPAPLHMAQRRDGQWLLVHPLSDNQTLTLTWLDAAGATRPPRAGDLPPWDRLLDAVPTALLLARPAATPSPEFVVDREIIASAGPRWLEVDVFDLAAETVRPLTDGPVMPIARLADGLSLMVIGGAAPQLARVHWPTGEVTPLAPWPAGRRFAGAVVGPDGAWAALGSQNVGQRWDRFDVDIWQAEGDRLVRLADGVLVAARPLARISPRLYMQALDERHLALVTTEITDVRGETPVDGQYHTLIADVERASVLCRFPHARPGLRDEVPPPYLPRPLLENLRITPPEVPGEPWRRFLRLEQDRLVADDGQSFAADALSRFALTRDGRALATAWRRDDGPPAVLAFVEERRPLVLPVSGPVEQIVWLAPAPH